jgi:hypothetical protein
MAPQARAGKYTAQDSSQPWRLFGPTSFMGFDVPNLNPLDIQLIQVFGLWDSVTQKMGIGSLALARSLQKKVLAEFSWMITYLS